MIMRDSERILIKAGFALMLTGYFWFYENSWGVITSKYQTGISADYQIVRYFDDSQSGIAEPIIRNVCAIGVIPGFFAVRDEVQYYLFVRTATTEAQARNTAIGPIKSRVFV